MTMSEKFLSQHKTGNELTNKQENLVGNFLNKTKQSKINFKTGTCF